MSFKGSVTVAKTFSEGRAQKQGFNLSTGEALYYHNNKIAEWRRDGLYISNGGYTTCSRSGNEIPGSRTTKDKLNALPGVKIYQHKCKWYINLCPWGMKAKDLKGKEWDGSWIKIPDVNIPKIDLASANNLYVEALHWVSTDGQRGYEEPKYACAGANDTGMWSDSPCRTDVCEHDLNVLSATLLAKGIKTKQIITKSSNIFCVHHYLLPQLKNVDRARKIVKEFLENNHTQLAYSVGI